MYNNCNDCSKQCNSLTCLDKSKHLSEFINDADKQLVRLNLGITDILEELNRKIDSKVIDKSGICWDTEPTEGNTEYVLSSHTLYNLLLQYVLKSELEDNNQLFWNAIINKINETYNKVEKELNLLNKDLKSDIDDIKDDVNYLLTSVDQLLKAKYESLEEDIRNTETLVKTFLKSHSDGTALSSKFGNEENIGINLKAISKAFDLVWSKLEDITGEIYRGFSMVVSPEYFVSDGENCNIHISINSTQSNGTFERISLYINGELLIDEENVSNFEYDTEISDTSTIRCVATIMGVEYEHSTTINHYSELWLGAGESYEDVMNISNVIPVSRGAYDVEIEEGLSIIIVVGKSLKDKFIRADLNGVEIQFAESDITIDGKQYIMLKSEPWSAGTYNIDING